MRSGVVIGICLLAQITAGSAQAEYETLSSERSGAWMVEHLEDQLDGDRRWIASADAADGRGSLIFKCDGGKYTEVYAAVIFPDYVGGDDVRDFTWRVDKTQPNTWQWNYSKYSAFSLKYASIWDMAVAVRDGKIFRARGVSYDHDTSDVVIPIDGARAALKAVFQGCGSKRWRD